MFLGVALLTSGGLAFSQGPGAEQKRQPGVEERGQPSAEQKEVDAVIYRIPLGQACEVTAKTGDVVDQVAALEANYSVSPTRRFGAAYGEHRAIFEKAKAGASRPDAIASALKAVNAARDLDLIDAIMTAHQRYPQGQFDEAYRAGERDLKAAQNVDWRSGDLDAGQRKALEDAMGAHGFDLARAMKRSAEELIPAGRHSPTLSPRVNWRARETKEVSEWATRATWRYGLSRKQGKAVCAMLVAIYRDNARASEKSARAGDGVPAAPKKPTGTYSKPTRTYEAVLVIVRPGSDVEAVRKELEAMNFTVRSINASDVKEDELLCDVIIRIDVDMDWEAGKTLGSEVRVVYEVNAPRLKKRDRWEESAIIGHFSRADADRFKRAREEAISWVRANVVSK